MAFVPSLFPPSVYPLTNQRVPYPSWSPRLPHGCQCRIVRCGSCVRVQNSFKTFHCSRQGGRGRPSRLSIVSLGLLETWQLGSILACWHEEKWILRRRQTQRAHSSSSTDVCTPVNNSRVNVLLTSLDDQNLLAVKQFRDPFTATELVSISVD